MVDKMPHDEKGAFREKARKPKVSAKGYLDSSSIQVQKNTTETRKRKSCSCLI